MGIYSWNKFRYLTCEISVFPVGTTWQNCKCGGYVPCCVTVNTHTIVSWKQFREMLLTTLAHNQHDVIDVIWRVPVWNVKIRRFLASCTLQLLSNLTKTSFQGKHFNYLCAFLSLWHIGLHIFKMTDHSNYTP